MYGLMATVMVPGVIVPRLPALPVLPPEFVDAAVLAPRGHGQARRQHQGEPPGSSASYHDVLLSPALTAHRAAGAC